MGLYEIESAARRIDAASVQLSRRFYLHIPAIHAPIVRTWYVLGTKKKDDTMLTRWSEGVFSDIQIFRDSTQLLQLCLLVSCDGESNDIKTGFYYSILDCVLTSH